MRIKGRRNQLILIDSAPDSPPKPLIHIFAAPDCSAPTRQSESTPEALCCLVRPIALASDPVDRADHGLALARALRGKDADKESTQTVNHNRFSARFAAETINPYFCRARLFGTHAPK